MQRKIIKNLTFAEFFNLIQNVSQRKFDEQIMESNYGMVRTSEILKNSQFWKNWISHATEDCANAWFQ